MHFAIIAMLKARQKSQKQLSLLVFFSSRSHSCQTSVVSRVNTNLLIFGYFRLFSAGIVDTQKREIRKWGSVWCPVHLWCRKSKMVRTKADGAPKGEGAVGCLLCGFSCTKL